MITGLNVAVNGSSDKILVAVSKSAGTTYTGTGTAVAWHASAPVAGQVTFFVPSGTGYTITAWGASTSSQLTGQTVTSPTTKTLTVS
jgi:hypothetical protein